MLGPLAQAMRSLGPSGVVWTSYVVASDVANATTNMADVTGLGWYAEANAIYAYIALITFQSSATTTGINFSLNTQASPTLVANASAHCAATTSHGAGSFSRADDTGAGAGSTAVDAINSNVPLIFYGNLVNGTTAGLTQLRFRAEAAGTVTIKAGSVLLVARVK